jgi:hypothetical protein
MELDAAVACTGAGLDQVWETTVNFWLPILVAHGDTIRGLRLALAAGDLDECRRLLNEICPPPAGGPEIAIPAVTMLAAIALDETIYRCGKYLSDLGNK